nr:zinc finger, CCHC-type [Tanacetum cinerariifolium]
MKAQSQDKGTVIKKLKDTIRSLSGKDYVENVKKDIDETETINIELEHSVAKLLSKNDNLRKEREHLKSIYKDQFDIIKKTRVQSKEQCDSLIAQINAKKLKRKNVVDYAISKPIATTIALGMYKLDIQPISYRLKNNRDVHEVYLEKTIENTNTLRGIIERVKCSTSASGLKPSGNTKNNRISQSSSSNKTNKVEDQSRSIKSRKNKNNCVDKTKCNAHVMQSMLNANSISETISNALVKHFVRNAKFESMCAICNKFLFDATHDMCLIDHVNDVNVRSKSKSKRNKNRKVWKPTGKVFTEIGYSWKPKCRNFTIIGNMCPLTRITSNNLVPSKKTTIAPVVTPILGILVYSRRPKTTRSVGSSRKVKIVDSNPPNTTEPNQSWGATVFDVPSSSLIDCRFGNDHIDKIKGYGYYQIDLKVSFRKHTCFIRDLEGMDLLKGSKGSNLMENHLKLLGSKITVTFHIFSGSSSNKKPKLECLKCGKTSHFKRNCRSGNKKNINVDAIAWWIDSDATTHVCKDHCWFKTYEPVKDGSVLYMGDDHFAHVHGKGSVVLEFSSRKSITLFNVLMCAVVLKTSTQSFITPYAVYLIVVA